MGPWTQADIDKYAAEHGGLARTKGPDASGLTTHYFGDGTYVTMLGDLPRMFGTGTLAEEDAAGAQPQQQRGIGMTQQELEAILGGFGTLGAGDFREEVKQEDVPNPAAYDENGQYIQGTPLTVKGNVTYRTWVKPGTNQRLTVKVNPDGSYTQVFSGADAGIKPDAQQAGTKEGDTRGPQNGPKREVFRRGEWVVEDNPIYRPEESTAKPQTVSTNTTEPYIVTRMPDGTLKTEKNPNYKGPEQKPGTILTIKGGDGKTYLIPIDAQGNPGPARDSGVPGESQQPLPADMPPFNPDPNKPGLGVIEYVSQLTALRAAGKLTDKQFTEFVNLAHQAATAEAGRLDTITRAQQTQQTNEINQRNADQQASLSRLGAANNATQNALDTSLKMAGNFTNDTYRGAGGPILPAVMALQDARAAAWGGMNQPAPIGTQGYPMLQQVAGMGMAPPATANVQPIVQAQPQAVAPAPAQAAPAPAQAAPAVPSGPPVFAPRTNMPTAVPPGAGAPVAPAQPVTNLPVTTQLPVQATGPNPTINPATGEPTGLNPLPPQAQGPNPAVNPVTGEPTGLPQPFVFSPVPSQTVPNMIQQQEGPVGGRVLPGPWNQPQGVPAGGNVQMAPGVLPAVNTIGIMSEVAAAGGYPQDVMEEAARRMGWL